MITVGEISGHAFAVSVDGTTRQLSEGERLNPGEMLHTTGAGSVVLLLPNGEEITVPPNTQLRIPPEEAIISSELFQLQPSDSNLASLLAASSEASSKESSKEKQAETVAARQQEEEVNLSTETQKENTDNSEGLTEPGGDSEFLASTFGSTPRVIDNTPASGSSLDSMSSQPGILVAGSLFSSAAPVIAAAFYQGQVQADSQSDVLTSSSFSLLPASAITSSTAYAATGAVVSGTQTTTQTISQSNSGVSITPDNGQAAAPTQSAPTAENDSLTVMSNQLVATNSVAPLGVLANDSTPNSGTLTVTQVGSTAVAATGATTITGTYGSLIIAANGTYSYTPNNGLTDSGVDTFTYTVSDGTASSTANLTVNILEDGFAAADSITVNESPLSATAVYMIDREGDSYHLSVVDTASGATYRLGEISGTTGSPKTIGMAPDGTIYVTDDTTLYTVNPTTLMASDVAEHYIDDLRGLTVSPDGVIYGVDVEGHIHTIDPENGGETTDLGQIPNFTDNLGDIVWHDGALYTQSYIYTNNTNTYQIVRIEPTETSFTATALPNTFDGFNGGSLHAMTSVGGELVGVIWGGPQNIVTIDTTTGLISERKDIAGMVEAEDAAGQGSVMAGNVMTNDTGAIAVTAIALPDGTSTAVGQSGATVQGMFGSVTIQTDGSYLYTLDNTLAATNNLASGETANERFVYTVNDASNNTAQSILTVFINGADEVSTADHALFSDVLVMDSVDATSTQIPVDFTVTTQNDSERITSLRFDGMSESSLNIPDVLRNSGTISGNTYQDTTMTWTATPGTNAGLTSFDAVELGLTLASINTTQANGQMISISATVTEYDSNGSATTSWESTSAVSLSLAAIDNTETGTSGNDAITGSSTSGSEIDEIIGGAGNDTMTGGAGSDFFVWQAADAGTGGTPATDTITDFAASQFGDVLDLRDLLPDNASDSLDEFLSFSFDNGDTTIGVSTSAGGPVVQNIVLDNVDLSTAFGTTDVAQLTNQLTDNGNLLS